MKQTNPLQKNKTKQKSKQTKQHQTKQHYLILRWSETKEGFCSTSNSSENMEHADKYYTLQPWSFQ